MPFNYLILWEPKPYCDSIKIITLKGLCEFFVTFLALNFFMTVLVFFKKVVVYERPWIFGTFAFCANPQAFLRHVHRSLVVLQVVFSISLILAFSA